jgi:hypothetical protein
MVAPYVTSIVRRNVSRAVPITDGLNTINYSAYYDVVIGSKQAKPVDKPLPYTRKTASAEWRGNVFWNTARPAANTSIDTVEAQTFSRFSALAYNKAYEKLKDSLFSQSQTGSSLGELNQSASMIANRAGQLAASARSARAGNIVGALSALSVSGRPPNKRKPGSHHALADAWLELHFGWVPMIQDIYDATEVLVRPIKTLWASERASESLNITLNGNNGFPYRCYGRCAAVCQAGIVVNNPNVVLANGLGLLNPAAVAWELVPFSFVADWFGNIGQVLGSMTDYMGTTLVNPYRTEFIKYDWSCTIKQPPYFVSSFGKTTYMTRSPGLPGPTLALKTIRAPSITRAATAISLLVQLMGDKRS